MPLIKLNTQSATSLDATKLTGNLPAISGASLTGISANAGSLAFYAYRNSDSADTTSGNNTELIFEQESLDDSNVYDTSTGRYTPGIVGTYYVFTHFTINDINSTSDDCYPKFFVNGTALSPHAHGQVRHAGASSVPFTDLHTSAVIKTTNTSDYISVFLYQDAGSSRKIKNGLAWYGGYRLA
tara:strand:+ start:552 stop:1100 length:549 start_codon:yes stop_codon:yes gene_type:complete